jgi:hypothetical protein
VVVFFLEVFGASSLITSGSGTTLTTRLAYSGDFKNLGRSREQYFTSLELVMM